MQMKYGVGSENRHNLDSRKRVFIPARIRDLLGKDLVIARDSAHGRRCLCIYSAEGWDVRLERLLEPTETEDERQTVLLMACRFMIPAELDDQGRVTLTKELVGFAGLEKEVVITGAGDHALLWSAAVYDEMCAEEDDFAQLQALLSRKRPKA